MVGRLKRGAAADVTVKERGRDKSVQQVLADGRKTGHFKLQGRRLQEVPEIWNEACTKADGDAWWDGVDPVSVDLSNNQIRDLPEGLCQLAETLETLVLIQNELDELPAHISALTNLKRLAVSGNHLSKLPVAVADFKSLQRLECAGNALNSLPPALGSDQPGLQHVDASDNALLQLPGSLAAASALLTLNVSSNRLSTAPGTILAGLRNLTSLNLSQNLIGGSLPESISCLSRLSFLDASRNKMTSLPDGIGGCSALVELLLGYNDIQHLPPSLDRLSALRTLDLRGNRLGSFPAAACALSLSLLDLKDNDLSTLPPELGRMTTLRALPLSGNPIRGLRTNQPLSSLLASLRNRLEEEPHGADSLQSAGAAAGRPVVGPGAAAVCFAGQRLTEVPDGLWDAAACLTHLDLSNNLLSCAFAGGLSGCAQLKVLDLSQNRLTEWPLPKNTLPNLAQLNLSGNSSIAEIPPDAFACCAASLQLLDLSGVPAVKSIVDILLASVPNLATLKLARSRLSSFPAVPVPPAGDSLRVIDVSCNQIIQVPEGVSGLRALEELNLANNDLAGLPARLGLLAPKLRILPLDGNPLRSIRRPILERGTQAVLEYLRGRIVE
ncbi:Leucine-rich repeat-containing protein 40 [Coccomyxa sp. Obi]|nr:Leucine-rich repeat-containing protein 40 [Coccomyxa sp. Obi]